MSESTSSAGIPAWVDLATTDPAAAKDFYTALFGWTFEDVPTPQGAYTMCAKDGKLVTALSAQGQAQQEMGIPPHWSTYINVDDADAAAAAATAAGGTVHVPPMDVMDSGRMAVIQDPTGAFFSVWQPRAHSGAELFNEPGALTWNELITDDTAAAGKFYTELFGWSVQTADMPTGEYTMFTAGEDMRAGMMAKTAQMGADMPNVWHVYFNVADVAAAVQAVADKGGTVVQPPFDVPGVGQMAVIADPQGAAFSIIEAGAPAG